MAEYKIDATPEEPAEDLNATLAKLNEENGVTEPARPEGLPDKFKDVGQLIDAYKHLESKMGAPTQDQPEAPTEAPTSSEAPPAPESLAIPDAPDVSHFDVAEKEFFEQGNLSDDTYTKLESAGIPRKYVDAYLEGMRVQATDYQNSIMEQVGGASEYQKIVAWAQSNLSTEEVQAYNDAIASSSPQQAMLTAKGLQARYAEANGSAPSLLSGSGTALENSVKPFGSQAEWIEVVQSDKYQTDSAFREEAIKRLQRSNF